MSYSQKPKTATKRATRGPSFVMMLGPGVVAPIVLKFALDFFLSQSPQNFAIEFSIHRLSWWNKFLMDDAFNIKLLPHCRSWFRSKVVQNAQGIITKCFFKHSVFFRSRLAEFEAELDANPLLLHISHFSRSVRSQNSTYTTPQKCADKTHTSSQKNAAWQNDSQRVELAIRNGAQLFYKWFSRGIPVSGPFGQQLVLLFSMKSNFWPNTAYWANILTALT